MNEHESEKLAGILTAKGYVPAEKKEDAGMIVLNTCCIRESAESRIIAHIGALKTLARKNPELVVIVCGCMSQQDGMEASLRQKFPFISIVLGTHNIDRLGEYLDEFLEGRKYLNRVVSGSGTITEGTPVLREANTNAWVNIMYGCNNFCSYCIVPYVRGRERSREARDILAEVSELAKSGKYKTMTLLGQNVNSYGKDLEQKISFAGLIRQAAEIAPNQTICFMTSHPKDFSDELIRTIAAVPNISKSIHLPVQSGSNAVLRAMNRGYTREDYITLTQKIFKSIPDAAITTDIIVGFPGETDEDYLQTEELVKLIQFNSAFIFMYSKRSGTVAAKLDGQIPIAVKRRRIHRLQEIQIQISRNKRGK